VVAKRGRPAAARVPPRKPWKSTKGILVGKVKIVGDIVNFNTAELWDAVRKIERPKQEREFGVRSAVPYKNETSRFGG